MEQMTKEQAIAFAASRAWERMTPAQIAHFQMEQERLCVPFEVFHRAVEETLGRPVFTHEYAFLPRLRAEFAGKSPAPGLSEILALLPADKTIVVRA